MINIIKNKSVENKETLVFILSNPEIEKILSTAKGINILNPLAALNPKPVNIFKYKSKLFKCIIIRICSRLNEKY